MDILVIGGTRYFGIHMVNELIKTGHNITIATRGRNIDNFGNSVSRIRLERTDAESIKRALSGKRFDIVYDKIAYGSNDIKYMLDVVDCGKYIHMSSTAVYDPKRWNTTEEDFDPYGKELIWCSRMDFPYEEIKRQAEYALWQFYKNVNAIAVRYPFVIGTDDYTKRLLFYIENAIKGIPMFIDNIDCQMSFIRSDEAGIFLAYLADKDYTGALNGAADGTVSIREVLDYVAEKTGKKAILDKKGLAAPYNNEPEHSINTDKAKKLNYKFSNLKDWIFGLIDYYIKSLE